MGRNGNQIKQSRTKPLATCITLRCDMQPLPAGAKMEEAGADYKMDGITLEIQLVTQKL